MAENSTRRWHPQGADYVRAVVKAFGGSTTGLRIKPALDVGTVDLNLTAPVGRYVWNGGIASAELSGSASQIRATVNPSVPAPVTRALATGVLQV